MFRYMRLVTGPSVIVLWLLGILLLGHEKARGQSQFNTKRVVKLSVDVCQKDDACEEVKTDPQTVAAAESALVPVACPADHPYLKNWDASYHEHIVLTVAPDQVSQGTDLTLIAHNQANASGTFQVVLGCSTTAQSVTSAMEWTGSLPTNILAVIIGDILGRSEQ